MVGKIYDASLILRENCSFYIIFTTLIMHTRIVQRKTNWALEISDWFARDATSPRPCWWSFSFGNETPFSWKFCEKKFYWIDQPAWPPCHVVANQKKYFNFIWTLQMLYCHFFGISLMKVLLLCSQEVVKGPDLNEEALWKKIFSALWSSVILWWWWWWWCGRGGGGGCLGKHDP